MLRRTDEPDDQAWLFMLAEPTLRSFAERISDDLPDDLAVLSQVQIPAAPAGSMTGGMGAGSEADGRSGGEARQPQDAGAAGAYSLGDFAAEQSYQISFSQHYRQLLLACL